MMAPFFVRRGTDLSGSGRRPGRDAIVDEQDAKYGNRRKTSGLLQKEFPLRSPRCISVSVALDA